MKGAIPPRTALTLGIIYVTFISAFLSYHCYIPRERPLVHICILKGDAPLKHNHSSDWLQIGNVTIHTDVHNLLMDIPPSAPSKGGLGQGDWPILYRHVRSVQVRQRLCKLLALWKYGGLVVDAEIEPGHVKIDWPLAKETQWFLYPHGTVDWIFAANKNSKFIESLIIQTFKGNLSLPSQDGLDVSVTPSLF